eukprot:1151581-Pelagomonas_calceolata.AAC.5
MAKTAEATLVQLACIHADWHEVASVVRTYFGPVHYVVVDSNTTGANEQHHKFAALEMFAGISGNFFWTCHHSSGSTKYAKGAGCLPFWLRQPLFIMFPAMQSLGDDVPWALRQGPDGALYATWDHPYEVRWESTVKHGSIHRRLAWPLHKDDIQGVYFCFRLLHSMP